MLLTDITKIIRVLLAAYQPLASQDNLTQRRLGQIGEVIGAVEDVAETEEADSPVAEKRVEEAHDIIHRVAAILAMEEDGGGDEDNRPGHVRRGRQPVGPDGQRTRRDRADRRSQPDQRVSVGSQKTKERRKHP